MNTFLPYPSYYDSAESLDKVRLLNQVFEATVIHKTWTLRAEGYKGWPHHPASLMWKDYTGNLLAYAHSFIRVCEERGLNVSQKHVEYVEKSLLKISHHELTKVPHWLGVPEFHRSHQSNLVRKDAEYYGAKFPAVSPDLPYIWPVWKKKSFDQQIQEQQYLEMTKQLEAA